MRLLSVLILSSLLMCLALPALADDRYVGASSSEGGGLVILSDDGKTVVVQKEPKQVGFDRIHISPEGDAVGWLTLHPNSATSNPIARKLVVYYEREQRTFGENELPISRWQFADGDKRIAFKQETVHGGQGTHYELRSYETGKLIEAYDPKPGAKAPRWVTELERAP